LTGLARLKRVSMVMRIDGLGVAISDGPESPIWPPDASPSTEGRGSPGRRGRLTSLHFRAAGVSGDHASSGAPRGCASPATPTVTPGVKSVSARAASGRPERRACRREPCHPASTASVHSLDITALFMITLCSGKPVASLNYRDQNRQGFSHFPCSCSEWTSRRCPEHTFLSEREHPPSPPPAAGAPRTSRSAPAGRWGSGRRCDPEARARPVSIPADRPGPPPGQTRAAARAHLLPVTERRKARCSAPRRWISSRP
jgi:hypothetical protein